MYRISYSICKHCVLSFHMVSVRESKIVYSRSDVDKAIEIIVRNGGNSIQVRSLENEWR